MIDSLIVKLLQQTFLPKLHQNTFAGRAPPGPAGSLSAPQTL